MEGIRAQENCLTAFDTCVVREGNVMFELSVKLVCEGLRKLAVLIKCDSIREGRSVRGEVTVPGGKYAFNSLLRPSRSDRLACSIS